MTKFLSITLALAIAASTIGCSRGDAITTPRTVADELSGIWAQSFQIPGASTVITLAAADSGIAGTGTYTIEAGQPGTIAVTGMISGENMVDLDLVRSDGWIGHFRGSLATHDSLSGYMWFRSSLAIGDPAPASFRRIGH